MAVRKRKPRTAVGFGLETATKGNYWVQKHSHERILYLLEFRCVFCEAEHGVEGRIITERKRKPWDPTAVESEELHQR